MRRIERFGLGIQQIRKQKTHAQRLRVLKDELNHEPIQIFWQLMLNPYFDYGITDLPQKGNAYSPSANLDDMTIAVFHSLNHASLVAQDVNAILLADILASLNVQGQLGLRAILRRTPNCKLNIDHVREAAPNLLPAFKPAEFKPYYDKEIKAIVRKDRLIAEPWYAADPVERRIFINHTGNNGQLYTSLGNHDKTSENAVNIITSLTQAGVVLDGWVTIAGNGFRFIVSESLLWDEWTRRECSLSWEQRRERTKVIVDNIGLKWVTLAPCVICNTFAKVEKAFEKLTTETDCHGVVFKPKKEHYPFRKTVWARRVKEVTETVQIFELLPGSPGTRFQYTLGSIAAIRANGKRILVNVTCLDEKTRDAIWSKRHLYPSMSIPIVHGGERPNGSLKVPRIPNKQAIPC